MEMSFPSRAMRLIKLTLGLVFASCNLAYANTQTTQLQPFDASYTAFQYGKELGQATLSLDALGRDRYRLSYQSKVSLFFLSDKREETSLFSFKDDKIIPFKYTYERSGFGSDKAMVAEFNQANQTITINKQDTVQWQGQLDNQLYRFDVQLQLAKNKTQFEYDLINNRGKPRHYEMMVLGKEPLSLPYGKVEGIKVKIMRENSTRETFAWFAPTLNYQLVRLIQFKDGEQQGDIQLASYQGPTTSVPSTQQ